jgi:hypothetical protein
VSEHEPRRRNPNIPDYLRNPEQDGRVLLPDSLKERMPALYSQEQERDLSFVRIRGGFQPDNVA